MSENKEVSQEKLISDDNILEIHNNMMLDGFKLIKEICDIIDQATNNIDKMEKYQRAWKKAWVETIKTKES